MTRYRVALTLCLLFMAAPPAHGWLDESFLVFASLEEGRQILGSEDAFIDGMSSFDRAARMKTDQEVSKEQFLAFVQRNVLQWESQEKQRVEAAFRAIRPALAKVLTKLPKTVHVIKTSGAEEGGATYTRGAAIVFPERMLAAPDKELQRVLAHELLHILSRNAPQLRDLLYETIGFHRCGELEFPPALKSRKITNPDAPKNEHCIRVRIARDSVWAIPILLSRTPRYDVGRGGEFFDYLQMALLVVARSPDGSVARAMSDGRGPRLVAVQEASGFFAQVGRNTSYVIHPEEILADNFALIMLGERDVPSPEVLERIKAALAGARPAESGAPADAVTPRR
jgi:hypothetical protein